MFDILIKNGKIIDGSGNPYYWGSVGIKNKKIAALGKLEGAEAKKVIDAGGKVVSPGFIDPHTHSDVSFIVDPTAQSKIRQGVTTELSGNCGSGAGGPVIGAVAQRFKQSFEAFGVKPEDLKADWKDFSGYLDLLQKNGGTTNSVALVGHGTLRAAVMGYDNRFSTPDELEKMKWHLADNLDKGAMGMSTGLFYAPGIYAETKEVVELAKVVAGRDKLYASHIRDEGHDMVGYEYSWEELLETGRKSGARVLTNHIKCLGPVVWGHHDKVIAYLERGRKEGINLIADQYPYDACGGGIVGLIMPRWAEQGGRQAMLARLDDPVEGPKVRAAMKKTLADSGGPSRLQVNWYSPKPEYSGLYFDEVCKMEGATDPVELMCQMVHVANCGFVSHILSEADMLAFAAHEAVTVGSDASSLDVKGPLSTGFPHPRNFGTFPRAIRLFVREHKLYSLETAVRKYTYMPAQHIGLTRRGLLREGYWADVIVFDPDTITDNSTYLKSKQLSTGVSSAIVNGVPVLENGEFTGKTPGRPLRGKND